MFRMVLCDDGRRENSNCVTFKAQFPSTSTKYQSLSSQTPQSYQDSLTQEQTHLTFAHTTSASRAYHEHGFQLFLWAWYKAACP